MNKDKTQILVKFIRYGGSGDVMALCLDLPSSDDSKVTAYSYKTGWTEILKGYIHSYEEQDPDEYGMLLRRIQANGCEVHVRGVIEGPYADPEAVKAHEKNVATLIAAGRELQADPEHRSIVQQALFVGRVAQRMEDLGISRQELATRTDFYLPYIDYLFDEEGAENYWLAFPDMMKVAMAVGMNFKIVLEDIDCE